MSNADPAPWEWLFAGRYMGFTLTLTRGLTVDELLERYGADRSVARPLPFAEIDGALQSDNEHAVLRVGALGEWAFGIEDSGVQGAAPTTLTRLSRGTETISVYNGANALQIFEYWLDGNPRERFEPGMTSTLRAAGSHPFWDAAERQHAARPETRGILSVMRAVEDHIQARLAQETDDGALLTLLLPQTRPMEPSPVPPLPLVNPPSNRTGVGRHLATLRLPGNQSGD